VFEVTHAGKYHGDTMLVCGRLHGFQITYDTENWEDFSIQELKDNPTN
jgi:hypothetical protein